MADTKISWADKVFNPITGCTPIAVGCQNCYAKKMSKRLKAMGQHKYRNEFKVTCHEGSLAEPLRWKKAKRIFVCSMSDLFHDAVPFAFIDKVFAVMALCPQHTFLLLSKRPSRMSDYFGERPTAVEHRNASIFSRAYEVAEENNCVPDREAWLEAYTRGWSKLSWPLPNVHLGTSCSTQADLDKNVPELLRCPAAVRWLSLEPLLEEITIPRDWLVSCRGCGNEGSISYEFTEAGHSLCHNACTKEPGKPALDGIVVGCESGPGHRLCEIKWIKSVVDQCDAAGVPVYVKQIEIPGSVRYVSTDMSEWPENLRRQELP